jgi:Cupin
MPDTKSELDFQTALAARAAFTADDIKFHIGKDITSEHGTLGVRNLGNDPFLATLPRPGASVNVVDLEPCGVIAPHVHPRGTELAVVTKGEIQFGFVEELGGRGLITATAKARESYVQPQGLIHFDLNPSCEPAQFITFNPATDAGISLVVPSVLLLPDEVIRATLGTEDLSAVKAMHAAVAAIPV